MSNFYGTLHGSRGQVTRQGHGQLTAVAASWEGSIRTTLRRDEDGTNRFQVWAEPWHGKGGTKLLAEGIVGQV